MNENILKEIKYLQNKCKELRKKYNQYDIRISIFDGFHAILCRYFVMTDLANTDYYKNKYKIIMNVQNLHPNDMTIHVQNHKNNSNSQLLVDSWSEFELFISNVSKVVLSKEDTTSLKNINYDKVIKELKKDKVEIANKDRLSFLIQQNFDLIASSNKLKKLLKLIISKFKSTEEYRKTIDFLDNYGRLRNCVHSNYIFHGKDVKTYEFDNIKYTYTPNKPIEMNPIQNDTFLSNFVELRKICEFIVDNIEYSECIYDSSHEVIKQ